MVGVKNESSYDSSSLPLDVSDEILTLKPPCIMDVGPLYMEALESRSQNEPIKSLPVLNHPSPPEIPRTAPDRNDKSPPQVKFLSRICHIRTQINNEILNEIEI